MTTSSPTTAWRAELGWYLGIAVACGVAFGLGGGVVAGLLAAAGMLTVTLVLAVGRRRVDALRVFGGAGDERNQQLYVRSLAASGGLLGLTVTGWFLLDVARGSIDAELLVLMLLFTVSFAASSLYYSRRG
jgi:hypothetical protein